MNDHEMPVGRCVHVELDRVGTLVPGAGESRRAGRPQVGIRQEDDESSPRTTRKTEPPVCVPERALRERGPESADAEHMCDVEPERRSGVLRHCSATHPGTRAISQTQHQACAEKCSMIIRMPDPLRSDPSPTAQQSFADGQATPLSI